MCDFDPAGRRLLVGERRASDRVENPVRGYVVGRDASLASPIVRIGDKELIGVRGSKLAPERAGALRRKRRTWRGRQMAVVSDGEAVDFRGQRSGADTRSDAS